MPYSLVLLYCLLKHFPYPDSSPYEMSSFLSPNFVSRDKTLQSFVVVVFVVFPSPNLRDFSVQKGTESLRTEVIIGFPLVLRGKRATEPTAAILNVKQHACKPPKALLRGSIPNTKYGFHVCVCFYVSQHIWVALHRTDMYVHTHRAREEGAKKSTQFLPPVFLTKPVKLNL